MAVHRPPCMSDQEHNVVSLIREEVDDDYLPDRWLHEREEEERLLAREGIHRFLPCDSCGGPPDIHNTNRGRDFIGHEYKTLTDWAPGELQEARGL